MTIATCSATVCVMSGASGSGKSTLLSRLFAKFPGKFAFSVSHTTRKMRRGETNGVDYHFVDEKVFRKLLEQNKMVEHTHFSGNYYGTSIDSLRACIDSGKICVLDLDMEGVKQLKSATVPSIFIYIQPPSIAHLRKRLEERGTDSPDAIERRLAEAERAMEFANNDNQPYDHIVVNDDITKTVQELEVILKKHFKETLG